MSSYDDMRYFQMCEEAGPEGVEPPALAFTGADMEEMFGPGGPDEDGVVALNLAMERSMAERREYWEQRALAAEARLREYERDYEPDE